ncbi:DEAD/DEAH box helicase [Paenibacillus doosanensis]|uniref:RNA helicase n=1 Tax=Paenibacillus konkukensis TaxID=2020716 RepID=A0ABY4RW62_9BACL|nr:MULTISPECIES: DEAD/DEAH box helicase [Paenibacillus]MCS7458925.1 DEAD/DEAH box helicase [Paenibacillus doosanensis]UQZ86547.1 DEAD-box ATP-dependent RNA helicase CshA [Paenibacillus konkukensis]
MNNGFATLHIDDIYVRKLQALNITTPSPIQAEAIPVILEGKDVVAQSQTGSGKTLAYTLPLLHKIDKTSKDVQGIVLVPTRELGVQIVSTLEQLTEGSGIRVQSLIGGAAISRQIDRLKLRPQIVVGTPGRVLELLKLRKLTMHHVQVAVVDEVDQVFELGSMHEVEAIFKGMLRERQLLFFSATLPPQVQAVIDRWMREPAFVQVNPEQRTSQTLEHQYFVCEERDKIDTLRRIVRLYNPPAAIVFINETDDVAEVVSKLQFAGLSIEALYGDAGKQDRAKVMQAFRSGKFQLLLATDIAARGLDIPHVTHVINLDPPIDADHYVHRVGRTGRMGKKGTAVSIITHKERFIINKFAKTLGIDIEEKEMAYGKVIDPGQRRGASRAVPRSRVEPAGRPAAESELAENRKSASGKSAEPRAKLSSLAAKAAPGGAAKPSSPQAKRKPERERDRKNKGAPRWLKEKQNKPKS